MCFRVQSIASAGEVFCASLAGQWAHRAGVAIGVEVAARNIAP